MRFSTDQETKGRILRLILERELSSEGAGQLKIEENKLTEIPVTDIVGQQSLCLITGL